MGSSGGEKSAKKAKKEKRGDKPESGGGGSSKKRGRDGLPVPSTPGDEEEDTKLNPVCAIASPLADGKLTKKALKVVKKGTRVLFFFVQQRGERRRRFFLARCSRFERFRVELGVVGIDGGVRSRRIPRRQFTKTSFSLFSHTHKNTTASKFKQVRRGVKEVVKQLKTAREGLCVIAGDISPIDVITHVPMLCEEAGVQYVYVHSKEQLGAAGMTKRPTSVMLVLPKAVKGSVKMGKDDEKEFEEMYKSVHSKVKGMHEK